MEQFHFWFELDFWNYDNNKFILYHYQLIKTKNLRFTWLEKNQTNYFKQTQSDV